MVPVMIYPMICEIENFAKMIFITLASDKDTAIIISIESIQPLESTL
jgi:hypothetical protein